MEVKAPNILLYVKTPLLGDVLEKDALIPAGFKVTTLVGVDTSPSILQDQLFDVAILEIGPKEEDTLQFLETLFSKDPLLPVILLIRYDDKDLILKALRGGVSDILRLPIKPVEIIKSIKVCLDRRKTVEKHVQEQSGQHITSLNHYIEEMKELAGIGLSLTSSLDLDHVLTLIVETAVKVTDAEEGSLLILDDESGELFIRAAKNFQDEFVHTFRLPVSDTLAGEVVRTGNHVFINQNTPQKIKTTYLVRALMYVPLQVRGKVIGVLGVDNREKADSFTKSHLSLVTTLADYAAVAIENASLYHSTEIERHKLNTVLTQIEDGVIVLSEDGRIILINRMANMMLGLSDEETIGMSVEDVILHDDFISLLKKSHSDASDKNEIELDDGYIINVQITRIPDVGFAVTMQDITYFKELDRVKSEFVNTVSHDLRSPLTAILGYVELITRVGEVNDEQREFINRVKVSVQSISELINALLELGRIEAGFDTEKEFVNFGTIIATVVDTYRRQIDDKKQVISVDLSSDTPDILGDPIHFRQIAENLISNAVRYTPEDGSITLRLLTRKDQIIFQVIDTGLGIPVPEQAFIYEKFYRCSNIPENVVGTGLGLAIVHSIVENYQGRIWVDSKPGGGTSFTIVLPINVNRNIAV